MLSKRKESQKQVNHSESAKCADSKNVGLMDLESLEKLLNLENIKPSRSIKSFSFVLVQLAKTSPKGASDLWSYVGSFPTRWPWTSGNATERTHGLLRTTLYATCASPACMKSLSGCHAVVNEIKRPTLSIQTSEVNVWRSWRRKKLCLLACQEHILEREI